MIDHPEERRIMGGAARSRMAQLFSTEQMVARTADLYESLASTRRRAGRGRD